MKKNVLITGGSGYVGTRLINSLLNKNYNIINYDISLYGDKHLPKSSNYFYEKYDLRDQASLDQVLKKYSVDTLIHLACISNDPTFELKSDISKDINFLSFEPLVVLAKKNKVKKFIYASTCSVYGVTDEPNVTENHPLLPITDYNKYKADCEPVLLKHIDNSFQGLIIRPATVCGFSEKMRFDLTVNILTNFAYNKGFIKVFGGRQTRPNIHIDDMCRLYEFLIESNISSFNGEIFNAGKENLEVSKIAMIVKDIVHEITGKNPNIIYEPSTDPRSYRINSDKIKDILNFQFEKTVEDAVRDLVIAFEKKKIKDSFSEEWQNISVLKKLINEKKY